jgi:homocitrate synthase NifV
MDQISVVDTTLRDGEQAPGVSFSEQEKINIVKKLDQAGVDIIEIGVPAAGQKECEMIESVLDLNLDAQIFTWNRMRLADVKAALSCGSRNLHVSVPVSDIQINKKLGRDKDWVLEKTEEVLSFCLEKNCQVTVGAEDASRADRGFLFKFYDLVQSYNVQRVRYADTLGILSPMETYKKMKEIKDSFKLDIDFHAHNDFGLATANALNAYKAGVRNISCTINGIGERAGNTAVEEIIMALKYIEEVKIDFDLTKLMELSKVVEKASGIKMSQNKAIVGRDVFAHESGIHVDGLLKDEENYQFFSPEDIGRTKKIVLGKSSGSSGVVYKFRELGLDINQQQADDILEILHRC